MSPLNKTLEPSMTLAQLPVNPRLDPLEGVQYTLKIASTIVIDCPD